MRLDSHVHTRYSSIPGYPFLRDSFTSFEDIIRVTYNKINAIAITDHNTISGALRFEEYCKRKNYDIKIIIGEEIRTELGDVIALYIDQKIPPKKSIGETLDMIKDLNGISIACHPYSSKGVGEENVDIYRFDLIETMNSCIPETLNHRAKLLSKRLNISEVGGSDAHRPEVIGNTYTKIPDDEPIRESLEKGRTKAFGIHTPYFSYFQKLTLRLKHPRQIFCNPFS